MKKILGLDIGTNSIGWALVENNFEAGEGKIIGIGSRILPTDPELLSNYEKGQAASKNVKRRQDRGARRLRSRYKLRRGRLIIVLKKMNWLPEEYTPGKQIEVQVDTLNEMRAAFNSNQVSDDWVVYYLRHKGLTAKLQPNELAMVLLNMNQRRGFLSNRKAGNVMPQNLDEEPQTKGKVKDEKKVEMVSITRVVDTGEVRRDNKIFEVHLQDGRIAMISRRDKPEWEGKEIEFEITKKQTRAGDITWELRRLNNSEADKWAKQKVGREEAIIKSGLKYPGNYYFHQLKQNNQFTIKDVTVDRKFYLEELTAILLHQSNYYPELQHYTPDDIAHSLYKNNETKIKQLAETSLLKTILQDIIYYQRPLKSKKSSIADCRFERKVYFNKSGKQDAYKAAPISSPIFQEFRIWQTINNLRVLQRDSRDHNNRLVAERDVTADFINTSSKEILFELFDRNAKVSQNEILKLLKLKPDSYIINLFKLNENKELPGNETKAQILKLFKKANDSQKGEEFVQDASKYYLLWHILYSIEESEHIINAIMNPANNLNITEATAVILSQAPAFKLKYSSLSHKALKKIVPIMRVGKYWNEKNIDQLTYQRIHKILNHDAEMTQFRHVNVLNENISPSQVPDFQGLNVAMACYTVYGHHSERTSGADYYESPEQVVPSNPLSLRNPIVEQVVNETLRLVRDVWKQYGRPFEIHIELARELKKNAEERERMSKRIQENEEENKRISAILRELRLGNPNSLSDIEKLKLFERQADFETIENKKEIKFKRPSEPTPGEIERYKVWLNQRFISPYSGKLIPLSQLFTKNYEVDHIIPRSRFFDDSFENKVVVESAINKDKGNMTAYEYFKSPSKANVIRFSLADFETHVVKNYHGKKKKLLLSEDVPDGFSNRHLNDSRYISRKLHELLAPVSENHVDPVIATTGSITSELKATWGLTETMKELVKWRFERMQQLTGEKYFWYEDQLNQDGEPTGKKYLKLKGYEKRIDHRHHALDALIIACTTRSHIKYLNDLNVANYGKTLEYRKKGEAYRMLLEVAGEKAASRKFKKPWKQFSTDAKNALEGVIVSFKKNVKIAGKKANRNLRYILQADGNWKKTMVTNRDKLSPYVRQPLHKETLAGQIELREYKEVSLKEALKKPNLIANRKLRNKFFALLKQQNNNVDSILKLLMKEPLMDNYQKPITKVQVFQLATYFVNKVLLDGTFDIKKIEKIPDSTLRKELREHLARFSGPKEAFGPEGLEQLNNYRKSPIYKVRVKEPSDSKYAIRPNAFTEAAKGTNLFFIIYVPQDTTGKRHFTTLRLIDYLKIKSLNGDFIERKEGYQAFYINPNDLIYLPDEGENISNIDWSDSVKLTNKLYRFVSSTGNDAYFVPQTVSKVIEDKKELGSLNKIQKEYTGSRLIKEFCIKLTIDRLGKIKPTK